MKKPFNMICLALLTLFANNTYAQPGGEPPEKVKRLRIAFISERLDLSPEEAEKFWPVFNAADKKRHATRKGIKEINREMQENESGEIELMNSLTRISELRKQEADNDLQLARDLIPVIGVEKVKTLAGLEEEFRTKLMDKIRERKDQRGTGNRPPPPR